jgi:hypothetical protein
MVVFLSQCTKCLKGILDIGNLVTLSPLSQLPKRKQSKNLPQHQWGNGLADRALIDIPVKSVPNLIYETR